MFWYVSWGAFNYHLLIQYLDFRQAKGNMRKSKTMAISVANLLRATMTGQMVANDILKQHRLLWQRIVGMKRGPVSSRKVVWVCE